MYELKKILNFADAKAKQGKKLCLATIIKTVGSSYRKTGTQMVLADDLSYEGALSGGCVESEVLRQSEKVFHTNENVVFEYDGQYKLGCNGKIYILIEPLDPAVLDSLYQEFSHHHKERIAFGLEIQKKTDISHAFTSFVFARQAINISEPKSEHNYDDPVFLTIDPQYQLVVIGGEYDSVSLAGLANAVGYQTYLVVKESFPHTLPASVKIAYYKPDELKLAVKFDRQTAIVLMTHSLSKDLNYLISLLEMEHGYLGILGPPSRKETILSNLMNHSETLFITYADKIENIYGPVGLDIGARTPEEISVSILSELIAVFSGRALKPLLES